MGRPALVARDGARLPAEPPPHPLAVRGLTVAYGDKPAVFSIDADFPAATLTAILGPNGAGKSSFLKGALGVAPVLAGETRVFGQPLAAARPRLAYVPQRASVDWDFPARAVDVAMMGLYRRTGLFRLFGRRERAAAEAALERVGMSAFAGRQIGQLSGGQQQRVFLARALAQEAELYLLDEPFAGVDAATERAIVEVLKALKAEGRTVVAVHHDLATVAGYFDRVLLLNRRKIAEGPVAEAFDAEALQAAYGGRLAATHLDTVLGRAEADMSARLLAPALSPSRGRGSVNGEADAPPPAASLATAGGSDAPSFPAARGERVGARGAERDAPDRAPAPTSPRPGPDRA